MTSSSHYDNELQELPRTYENALAADISTVTAAIAGASDYSIIAVGSGGSFTVASLLCNLHETYTGRTSRPATPLEIICSPALASTSPVFLISAEGKNPDALEALKRARRHSSRAIHVLSNRSLSPLVQCANKLTDVNAHVFELLHKDGFLATNSLLMDAMLVARAYGQLDKDKSQFPPSLEELKLQNVSVDDWISTAADFVVEALAHRSIIVVFSPLLRPVAADLESKLSESALLYCQITDLRSFAHGRHLWLADRPNDCAILSLIEPSLIKLWNSMLDEIPSSVPTLTMPCEGSKPRDLLAGIIAEMKLVAEIGRRAGKDPGRPSVPEFGSRLHYADLGKLIPPPASERSAGEQSKYNVLGARWPSIERRGAIGRALETFIESIEKQIFRAVVFDYDGVLCSSRRNDLPPQPEIVQHLTRLIDDEILVGVASGRGGSIQENLRATLPERTWDRVQLGLYNCGFIGDLRTPVSPPVTSEFLSHVTRIMNKLQTLGAPIECVKATHPYQVSVRFRRGVNVQENWVVVADALGQAGIEMSRVVRSKHSVDILAPGVNKSHLVKHIVQKHRVSPYEVVTVGDQGAWPGNDHALLEHRYSLSVDEPSRRLDRGWKIAPAHLRDVDATLWYLDRIQTNGGTFIIRF